MDYHANGLTLHEFHYSGYTFFYKNIACENRKVKESVECLEGLSQAYVKNISQLI